jgi:60 kDa SS-A/Ro ribonucleoprotein
MSFFNKQKGEAQKTTNLAGGQAYTQSAESELVTMLLVFMGQDQFYRKGSDTFSRLLQLANQVNPEFAAKAAIYARNEFGMRTVSQFVAATLAQRVAGQPWAKDFYNQVVFRPDDMLEIAALFKQKQGDINLTNAMKKGFAQAFGRFDAYQLAKYRSASKSFKMVDLVNLVRPVPTARNAEALKQLVAGDLVNTQTWEARLTEIGKTDATDDEKANLKGEAWMELLQSNKLGYLALLRNLRNIAQVSDAALLLALTQLVDPQRVEKARVMPFQLLIAQDAINASDILEKRFVIEALTDALEVSMRNVPVFEGKTLVVLDDSGSMATASGGNFQRSCIELGAVFAATLYKSNRADLMTFSNDAQYKQLNSRDSIMSIANYLVKNATNGGTNFNAIFEVANVAYDRIIILSDMQGWMGGNTPEAAFKAYKKRTGANPFVYSFDLAGYGTGQLPEQKIFALAGLTEKVFDLMQKLEGDKNAMVNAVKAIKFGVAENAN